MNAEMGGSKMRAIAMIFATVFLSAPAMAAGFSCSQIPDAQAYIDKLGPGPNTTKAQSHLEAAKQATSDGRCVAELRQANTYARRSAAADRRMAMRGTPRCADTLHQDRPGGTDYHGPAGTACH
jgi:hypothetical protein